MHKKIGMMIALCFFTSFSFAETCPDIKTTHHLPSGWKLFDSDNGTPLSPQQEANFISKAAQFTLAEWTTKTGMIHCYYNDRTGSHLEAYAAKADFSPQNNKNYWYQVSGYMHCAAGMDKCAFQKNILTNTQVSFR